MILRTLESSDPWLLSARNAQIWAFVEEHARKQKKFRLREDWLQEMKAKMAATADKRRREFQSR